MTAGHPGLLESATWSLVLEEGGGARDQDTGCEDGPSDGAPIDPCPQSDCRDFDCQTREEDKDDARKPHRNADGGEKVVDFQDLLLSRGFPLTLRLHVMLH